MYKFVAMLALILCQQACTQRDHDDMIGLLPLASPAGLGSMTPHLQTGEDGTLVMSWLEPHEDETALRYSSYEGTAWSQPVTIATGGDWFVNWADFPSVAKLRGGLWAAHWLQKSAPGTYAYDLRISLSADGLTWSESMVPHQDGTPTEHGFASLHQHGDGFIAVWLDGRNMTETSQGKMSLRWAAMDTAGRISADGEIDTATCDCCQTDIAPVENGIVTVYRDRSESEIRDISAVQITSAGTGPIVPVAKDNWRITGCPVNGPAIAAEQDALVVAWFTAAADTPAIKAAFSGDGGLTFSTPIELASGSPLGRVDVVWLDAKNVLVSSVEADDEDAVIVFRRISADGAVGEPIIVAKTTKSRRSGFPQLAVSGEDLIIAWTEVSDQTQVRTAAIPIADLL